MCEKDIFLATVLAVFAIICLGTCRAYDDLNVVYVPESLQNTTSLICYDCNSEYNPSCGDPFTPNSIASVICSARPVPEHLFDSEDRKHNWQLQPTVCRKIVQKVDYGQQGVRKRVIRECGYIQDEHDDKKCLRRSGTMGVETYYCSCTKSYCNGGTSLRPSFNNLGGFIVVALAETVALISKYL